MLTGIDNTGPGRGRAGIGKNLRFRLLFMASTG